MVLFYDYSEIVTKNIVIKKPLVFSQKYKTKNIKYKIIKNKDNNEDRNEEIEYENLCIQTPYIFIRYCPSNYEGNIDSKLSIDLPLNIRKKYSKDQSQKEKDEENEYDIEIKKFYDLIKKIHKSLKAKLIKKEGESLSKKDIGKQKLTRNQYIECLKEKEDYFDSSSKLFNLKTKIHSLNGKPYIRIYANRKLCKEQKLKPNTLTRFILHLESIWYFEDSYGFNWYATQAEFKLPEVPLTYSFYNEDELQIEKEENKPTINSILPVPPPPPPPFPIENNNNNRLAQLKETIMKNKNKNKNSNNILKFGQQKPRDFRVPTVNQLQEKLKNLKKIKN
jgi:hypothetical protein